MIHHGQRPLIDQRRGGLRRESDPLVSERGQDVHHQHAVAYGTISNGVATPSNAPGQAANEHLEQVVAWGDLPKKPQLLILALARMSEPLVQTSLRSYMFYQLKSFDPALSDAAISSQAGVLFAGFTAAQLLTAILWGRVADSRRVGRKNVILIGLLGTSMSCLGFGFSTSFWQALMFRTLGGITNGNVAVMRTMISEIINERRFQARAFLLLPIASNIGNIIGPTLGGVLADPAGNYPNLFGSSLFFNNFPYAAPNIVSSFLLFLGAMGVGLGLDETLSALQDARPDMGARLGSRLAAWYGIADRRLAKARFDPVTTDDAEPSGQKELRSSLKPGYTQTLRFRHIFTSNLALTMLSHFFLTLHVGTFNSLWAVFLSTPVQDLEASPSTHQMRLPFKFTGGLGFPPQSVGLAMAIVGVIGTVLQLLFYPRISGMLGTLMSWRISLHVYPITYFLMPYLSLVPSTSKPPNSKTGVLIWASICALLSLHVTAGSFALPSQFILTNNCSPHPNVLATVHGLGHSVSCFVRTIGPIVGGFIYGLGLRTGFIGLVFWMLSCVAICACLASLLSTEGNGHEIWLDGDEEERE